MSFDQKSYDRLIGALDEIMDQVVEHVVERHGPVYSEAQLQGWLLDFIENHYFKVWRMLGCPRSG